MLYSYTKQLLTKYKKRYHQWFIKTQIQFDTCNVSCLTLRELIQIHLSFHPSIHPYIHTYTWTYLPPDLQPFKLCDTRSLRLESKLKYKGTEWYEQHVTISNINQHIYSETGMNMHWLCEYIIKSAQFRSHSSYSKISL